MELHQQMADIVEQNVPLHAAEAIARIIKGLSQQETEAALYFALMQAERKGQEKVAKMFDAEAEDILASIKALNQLNFL